MEVTKEMLNSYRSNQQEIRELEYILKNRWKSENMISVDTILNYNKGYPVPEGVAGFDQEKYERLQHSDMKRKEQLEQECKAVEEFVDNISESRTRRIFQLYFLNGDTKPTQSKVARKVHMERSNISKKIDSYMKVSQKSQKSHV